MKKFNTIIKFGLFLLFLPLIFTNRYITPIKADETSTLFEDGFEDGLSKWETVEGMWHITENNSPGGNSSHSGTHSIWFGNESSGAYNSTISEFYVNGSLISKEIDLSMVTDAFLELYHWIETEESFPYDTCNISIIADGIITQIYDNNYTNIAPWQMLLFNLTNYCGSKIQIIFYFDTVDGEVNHYRGWLIDDIKVYTTNIPKTDENDTEDKKKLPGYIPLFVINLSILTIIYLFNRVNRRGIPKN